MDTREGRLRTERMGAGAERDLGVEWGGGVTV